MPIHIEAPTRVQSAGNKPKLIDEYLGRVNTGHGELSVAHMRAPGEWEEPAQRPDFDELTLVLAGTMYVEHEGGELAIEGGQAVLTRRGERVRYRTGAEGAEYVAVCWPAFSPETVHRDPA